jgi:hypothetical protein
MHTRMLIGRSLATIETDADSETLATKETDAGILSTSWKEGGGGGTGVLSTSQQTWILNFKLYLAIIL